MADKFCLFIFRLRLEPVPAVALELLAPVAPIAAETDEVDLLDCFLPRLTLTFISAGGNTSELTPSLVLAVGVSANSTI